MKKIYEFVNDEKKSIINEIKMLIFFDKIWMFPEVGFEIMNLTLDDVIDDEIINLVENIIFEMNNKNISPDNWEDSFYNIISKYLK